MSDVMIDLTGRAAEPLDVELVAYLSIYDQPALVDLLCRRLMADPPGLALDLEHMRSALGELELARFEVCWAGTCDAARALFLEHPDPVTRAWAHRLARQGRPD